MKAVCRQWKSEVDSQHPSSLCLYYLLFYPPNIQWAFTNQLVGYQNSFQITNAKQIDRIIQKLRPVRRCFLFMISTLDGYEELISRIGEFEHLEQLEIYGTRLPAECRIESTSLKSLSLKYSTFRSLQLDTPSLEALICHEAIRSIQFRHPQQLNTLLVAEYDAHIKQLVNLERLSCIVLEAVDSKFLESLPKLKQIQLNHRNWDSSFDDPPVIRELRKQRFAMGRADLDIIAFCFDSTFYRVNDPDFAITSANVRWIRDNYTRIPADLPFLFEVDYAALTQTFKPLPGDFFAKFTDIEVVRIGGQVEQTNLMQFLKQCAHLYSVWIQSSSLGQAFFDQLHEIQALEELTIEETEWRIRDYDFLDRLTRLQTVMIYSPRLSVEFFRRFFERVRFANELYFRNTSYASERFEVSLFVNKNLEEQSFEISLDDQGFRRFDHIDGVLNSFRDEAPRSDYLLDS